MSTAAASRGRIVVGLDGSAPSDAALAWAVAEAAVRGTEVVAVHALAVRPVVAPLPSDGEAGPGRLEAAGRRLLQESLARTPGHERVPVRARVVDGPPVAALAAESAAADLLVLGTRGHGGLPGLLLGSTGYGCLHVCRCPVVLVHGPDTAGTPGGPIVVGVDGSPGSVDALTWALAEAARREAKVHAVLAWQDPYTVVGPPPPTWVAGESLHQLGKVLDASVEHAVVAVGPDVAVAREVRSGNPVDVLTEAARGAALLVVGSRGRSPVRAAFLGSVSQRCVQSASVPVVVVRRTDPAEAA
ncbi:MAG TPA: universal stress protein [Acidimicrobiales bacterium]|nr:universal stress protein [Acidimicrobiales bacterium]